MNASAEVSAMIASDTFVAPNGMTLQHSKLYFDPRGYRIAKLDANSHQLDGSVTDHAMSYYIDYNLISAENVPGADARFTHDEAIAFVSSLDHAGYRDWKLPDLVQAVIMRWHKNSNPAVDLSVHPGTTSSYYWTDEETQWSIDEKRAGSSRSFWVVGMLYGNVSHGLASYGFRARPVRVAAPAGQ